MSNNTLAVIGTSFGDEGKAKIVDYLSKNFDYVVRYQGGDNAGHSVFAEGEKYIFQSIPCGILRSTALISHGVALNPDTFFSELQALQKRISVENKIFVSESVHIICDWNIAFDKLIEQIRGKKSVGTTGRGIGPTYSNKALRLGLRAIDLLDKESLREKIRFNLEIYNPLFERHNMSVFDLEVCVDKCFGLGQKLKPFLVDSYFLINQELSKGKKVLFEGSQGLLLDIDLGTYPFVTSSSIYGSLISGTGIPTRELKNILGVVKAYSTRVGNGEFVSEIFDEKIAGYIRDRGNEYGSVTGRPRRIGWLDLVATKYSCSFSGVTEIALTLVDVLNGMQEIKVCVDYLDENGNPVPWKADLSSTKIKPVYKSFSGWSDDYSKLRSYEDFSEEFKNYVGFIEEYLDIKITIVSFGKDRTEVITRN